MYERFFGLVDAPFRLTPDPRYLFLSRKHAEALAHLRLGLSESSGFVCITGEVGTGKTTLLRAFLSDIGPEVATAYIFNPALSALELVQTINSELGLPASSTSQKELIDELNAHLLAQRKAGRISVVIIDEAQALSVDVLEQLRLLSNLETTTEKLLRVVLVGQPQLKTLLLHPSLVQLNQRITLRWHMGPLTHAETVGYVKHRLGVASRGQVKRLFSRPALWLVHRFSSGIPRLVNMIAHRALLAAFAADRRTVGMRSVLQAYREIGAVPLPRPIPASRRTAWATAFAAVFVGVLALGAPRFGWWNPEPPGQAKRPAAHASNTATDVPATPIIRDATPATPVEAAAPEAVESAVENPSTPAAASDEAPQKLPAANAVAMNAAPEAGPPLMGIPAADLEQRLTASDAARSGRSAVEAVLAAWRVRPLAPDEVQLPDTLESVAWRRGLDDLLLTGNRTMLRLFDLPAVLELRIPGATGARYVALTGMDDQHVFIRVDGEPLIVETSVLDRFWLGRAHVLWKDFEGLGATFGQEGRGVPVARLQNVLRRAGLYNGAASGEFDAATASAVLDFQRSRLLVADGRVGRLTRIVLYAAAGGYPRPTLAAPAKGAS